MQGLGVGMWWAEALELSEPTGGIWPRTPWTDLRPLPKTEEGQGGAGPGWGSIPVPAQNPSLTEC